MLSSGAPAVGVKRLREPGDILNPDIESISYLQRKFEGMPDRVESFKKWFNDMLGTGTLPAGLKFTIHDDDLDIAHWDSFKAKFCTIVPNDQPVCRTLVSLLDAYGVYALQGSTNQAEMTVNGIVDSLLTLFSASFMQLRERNIATATSAGNRPDFSLLYVFIGEDKTEANFKKNILGHDPAVDLEDTTPFEDWSDVFGDDVPFIFGYTCVGSTKGAVFVFGLIDRSSEKFHPLHEPLNLFNPVQRARAAEYMMLIRPWLVELYSRIQKSYHAAAFEPLTRRHLSPPVTITIQPRVRNKARIVEKQWLFASPELAEKLRTHITNVFQALNNSLDFQLTSAGVIISRDNNCCVKGFFRPYGSPCILTCAEEVERCALCILQTIVTMRTKGVVHNDLRLANIITVKSENKVQYVIIDFDYAQIVDERGLCGALKEGHLNDSTHCPDTFKEHGSEVDLWSLGFMLQQEMSLNIPGISGVGVAIQSGYRSLSLEQVKNMITKAFESLKFCRSV